jgi:hypothetical protein
MSTKTRAQLVAMALDELFAVGTGQSAEAEDTDKVDSRFDGLAGELALRGVVSIANEGEIPAEWCGPLSELLANECGPAFGIARKSMAERDAIEDRLRVMVQRVQAPNRTLRMDSGLRSLGGGSYTQNRWQRDL